MRPACAWRTLPGPLSWDDPPPIDLPALALSPISSHRPSCPKARRAMPREWSGLPVARPRHHQSRCPGRRLGRLPARRPDHGPVAHRHPEVPVCPVVRDPWRLVPAGSPSRTSSRSPIPVASRPRLTVPVPRPLGVCSPALTTLWTTRNPRSRGIFESPGLSPDFLRHPQESGRRPLSVPCSSPPFPTVTSATPGRWSHGWGFDEWPSTGLNDVRDVRRDHPEQPGRLRSRDHHSLVHVEPPPRARRRPPGRLSSFREHHR